MHTNHTSPEATEWEDPRKLWVSFLLLFIYGCFEYVRYIFSVHGMTQLITSINLLLIAFVSSTNALLAK